MSQDYNFNDAYILGADVAKLTRPQLLELARGICRALMDVEGKYHGNIHSANISRTPDGEAGLGPKADHGPGDWTSDELEYMAPELFWNRDGDITADVYSVGLLLFAGVSGGRLPFFPEGNAAPEPAERAAALRRRMSGEVVPVPAAAGEKLGAIIKKALAYEPGERFSGPVELLSALADCPDAEDSIPAALPPVKNETPEMPAYKVDKNFEENIPPRPKKNRKPAMIIFGICAAIVILALIIQLFSGTAPAGPSPDPSGVVDAMTGDVSPSPFAEPTPTVSPEGSASPEPTQTAEPEGTPSPSPSPSPSHTPSPSPSRTPSPSPSPSPTPAPEPESTYELYIEDISWTDAAEKCREMGGHMVTISDAAELKKVTDLADDYGVRLVWIGFYRDQNGNLVWLNDEDISYYVWGKDEPSAADTDGTPENYGLLWKYGPRTGWIYNDSRNDPVSDFPAAYSGKIAYICEYEG